MSYPVASGAVSHAATLIPEVWAPKFLIKFYERTVMNYIANTEYEGQIKNQGDTVHINITPTIEIVDHVKGQELDYERPQSSVIDLVIDKGKAYRFVCSDIDKKQASIPFMERWTDDAAKEMKIDIERDIFADIYSDADSANAGNTAGAISGDLVLGASGSPVTITDANVIDFILDMGLALDEQNIPDEDRWCILPSKICRLLKASDLKDASMTGDGKSTLRSGMIGMIDRFPIYQSNLLDVTSGDSATNVMAGHKSALTFASQLTENEVIRAEKEFADYARGLQVYGYKVIKPTALVHGYTTT
jgi:hypothetical protein